VKLTLQVEYPPTYPEEPPILDYKFTEGFDEITLQMLKDEIQKQVGSNTSTQSLLKEQCLLVAMLDRQHAPLLDFWFAGFRSGTLTQSTVFEQCLLSLLTLATKPQPVS